MQSEQVVNPFTNVIEQFVDDGAFLWVLRSIAVHQPHYTIEDLAELEQRISSCLDGVLSSPDLGWEIALAASDFEDSGESFVLSATAFRSMDVEKIKIAVEKGLVNDKTFAGLVSAMGWLPGTFVHSWVKKFFTSKELVHKHLAVAACSVRREDPREYLTRILEREDCREDFPLYSRALRLVGELKRHDLKPELEQALSHEDDEIRFYALSSLMLLGSRQAALALKPYVFAPGPLQQKAMAIAFRVLAISDARSAISELAATENAVRSVVEASGILGDPQAVPWLILQMRNADMARIAGEAFTLITGINLEENGLAIDIPDLDGQMEAAGEEPASEELDADENLPWPNVDKIAATWKTYGVNFAVGTRYFMGRPIERSHLKKQLTSAYQRQRKAAVLELALMDAHEPLVNVSAKNIVGDL